MANLLINCTAHDLTKEQIADIQPAEISNLKNCYPGIYERLLQCPDDDVALDKLARELYNYLESTTTLKDRRGRNIWPRVWVLLPIGSPAFMYIFAQKCDPKITPFVPIFSHSIRESVENPETGEKRSVFKHKKFIWF